MRIPIPLQDQQLLDTIGELHAQLEPRDVTGSFVVRFHYGKDEGLAHVEVEPPKLKFLPKRDCAPGCKLEVVGQFKPTK